MTSRVAGYVARDNLRHDGIKYEPGDELDAEDFTEQQLEQLLANGVIVAGMVGVKGTDIGDELGADDKTGTGDDPDASGKAGTGNEPDAGDKTDSGNEPDAGDKTDTGNEPGTDDKTATGDENQTGAETKSEASESATKPKKK